VSHFITYVFGEDNLKKLNSQGVDNCVLLTKEPFAFDLVENQYRNKLQVWKQAMEDFDEIVFLDWDCRPNKRLPIDYWKKFEEKESFQACLGIYKQTKCYWRKEDRRKVPNAGYCYIRDKTIPDKIIKAWEENTNKVSCEPAIALYLDQLHGGWIGIEKYWELYDPESCRLRSQQEFYKDRVKDNCFEHYAGAR